MDLLFFISVACFFALFIAALAVARHVRIERVHRVMPEEVRQIDHVVPERQPLLRRGATQSVQSLRFDKEPDWRFLVSGERESKEARISARLRKPPASVRSERPNSIYFNNDPGDLSDPYQPPITRAARAGSRRSLLALPRKEAS